MPKIKYYAINRPDFKKIVTNWSECEQLSKGIKGTLFKSFSTREEAKAWLDGVSLKPQTNGLRIFVDGSFSSDFQFAGWAFVVVENEKEIDRGAGISSFPAESRNIDGELLAAYNAMKWLEKHQKKGIICHDYEGIARWALGQWKAKSTVALRYIEASRPFVKWVEFEKVEAHSGNKWNELADTLAKKAIENAKKQKNEKSKSQNR